MPHPLTRPYTEHLWDEIGYRNRIGFLAAQMAMPWPMTATMAEVAEYRAHLVMFRMEGTIVEHLFDTGMKMAATMEHRIALKADRTFTP